jgi:hypothetical protein
MRSQRITQHAIQRFIERVDEAATPSGAADRIAAMLKTGRVRPNPRWWTGSRPEPGTVFVYSAAEPDACLLATRNAVVTVVSRDLCAITRRHREAYDWQGISWRRHRRSHSWRQTALQVAA